MLVISQNRHRVVVYQLDEENQWIELGMGWCEYMPDTLTRNKSAPGATRPPGIYPQILVHSETEHQDIIFFRMNIYPDTVYRQEQDTIIAWSDPDGNEYALSFEDGQGCERYWDAIHKIQSTALDMESGYGCEDEDESNTPPTSYQIRISNDVMANQPSERDTEMIVSPAAKDQKFISGNEQDQFLPERDILDSAFSSSPLTSIPHNAQTLELPTLIDIQQLQDFEDLLQQNNHSWMSRLSMARSILSSKYIEQLFDFHEASVDKNDTSSLNRICSIFKKIVMLHNTDILEYLLQPEHVFRFVAVFDHDPDIVNRPDYRSHSKFLRDQAVLCELVIIQQPELKRRIDLTFRAQYIRDIVLCRVISEEALMMFNNVIKGNYQFILDRIEYDESFLPSIASLLDKEQEEAPAILLCSRLVLFIKELSGILKILSRELYLARLFPLSFILSLVHRTLSLAMDADPNSKDSVSETIYCATDLLITMIAHFTVDIRLEILQSVSISTQDHILLGLLIRCLHGTKCPGTRSHCANILRSLLINNPNDPKNEEFLNLFYSRYVHLLLDPLQSANAHDPDHLVQVCTILSSCLFPQHTYRIKYIILGGNVLQNVALFFTVKAKYLILAAIRVFRTILGLTDEFYNRYMIKHRLFANLVPLLAENCSQNTMLASALLELFEFIRIHNIRIIIDHLMDNYGTILRSLSMGTFQGLVACYDQNRKTGSSSQERSSEAPNSNSSSGAGMMAWQAGLDHEETYFSSNADEPHSTIDWREPGADANIITLSERIAKKSKPLLLSEGEMSSDEHV